MILTPTTKAQGRLEEVKNETIYQYVTFPIYENSSGTTKTLPSMFSIPMEIKSIQKEQKRGSGRGGVIGRIRTSSNNLGSWRKAEQVSSPHKRLHVSGLSWRNNFTSHLAIKFLISLMLFTLLNSDVSREPSFRHCFINVECRPL